MLVAGHQAVQVVEGVEVGGAVAGDGHVAGLARQRRARIVTGARPAGLPSVPSTTIMDSDDLGDRRMVPTGPPTGRVGDGGATWGAAGAAGRVPRWLAGCEPASLGRLGTARRRSGWCRAVISPVPHRR